MEQLTNLELTLLDGLIQKYPSLQTHIPFLKVTDRKKTGTGMQVDFDYTNTEGELTFSDTNALFNGGENIVVKGLKQGLSYVIDVTDGKILYIEFSTYGENWKGEFGDFKIVNE